MEIGSGWTVGGYTLTRQLGAGAMGAVYLARHRSLPRNVAVKVLHPAFAEVPEFRARFEQEADVLCALDHPNIVDVQDKGQDGRLLYIVMDYVDGPDLDAALLERGPFAPEQAVEIIDGVSAALDHAHAAGLLHRDVKPANILLKRRSDGTEQPMLTDFGIAKNLAEASQLTRSGPPATIAYAAPEQLGGHAIDGRADVYSLAAVLFELLTGRRAFPVEDPMPLMAAVLTGPVPDPRSVRSDLPPALAAVVVRALAKDPDERPRSCAGLVEQARAALARRSPAPPTVVGARQAEAPIARVERSSVVPVPGAIVEYPGRVPTRAASARRTGWRVVLAAAVLVLAVVAVLAFLLPRLGSGSAGTPDTGTTSGGSTGAPPAGLAVGDCLDNGGARVSCQGPHATEVYSTSDCGSDQLLAYLGGRARFDVLRSDVVLGQQGGACTVGWSGSSLGSSSHGVLGTRAGDAWRRCLDSNGAELPCDQRHTAEVVYVRSDPTQQLDCTSLASDYLGTAIQNLEADLDARQDGDRCLVVVRGRNVLTASLAHLGANALPVEAAG